MRPIFPKGQLPVNVNPELQYSHSSFLQVNSHPAGIFTSYFKGSNTDGFEILYSESRKPIMKIIRLAQPVQQSEFNFANDLNSMLDNATYAVANLESQVSMLLEMNNTLQNRIDAGTGETDSEVMAIHLTMIGVQDGNLLNDIKVKLNNVNGQASNVSQAAFNLENVLQEVNQGLTSAGMQTINVNVKNSLMQSMMSGDTNEIMNLMNAVEMAKEGVSQAAQSMQGQNPQG
jgi:hypothetical protein